jgi:transposase
VTSAADAVGVASAYLEHGYRMREIATHLGCGVSTVHRRVRAVETERETSPAGTWKT